MEGLILAQALLALQHHLPANNLGWAFPNETSAALLLEGPNGVTNLVFAYAPPEPSIALLPERFSGQPHNPFQRGLESKAKGRITHVQQHKLDRVFTLGFEALDGFVAMPAVRLVFELTGRNCNLILLGEDDRIRHAAREITANRNRFRQVRTGGLYTPPPPYDKPDPRALSDEALQTLLHNRSISKISGLLDGIGPNLSAELAARSKTNPQEALQGEILGRVLASLRDLANNPTPQHAPTAKTPANRLYNKRKAVAAVLEKQVLLVQKQLEDVARARNEANAAATWREHADALMAYAHSVPAGSAIAVVPNLYGDGELRIPLSSGQDARQTATGLYERAKRREAALQRLEEREPRLLAKLSEQQALLQSVETLDNAALDGFLGQDDKASNAIGLRLRSKHGFVIVVGRNSKENDLLTFGLARSHDLWFHVQAYPGSHVLLRSEQKEVPFEDILEAATLAAYHSKAKHSSNVAVDYVLRKNLWRPKGAKPGQVHFSGQRTVYVNPQDLRPT